MLENERVEMGVMHEHACRRPVHGLGEGDKLFMGESLLVLALNHAHAYDLETLV